MKLTRLKRTILWAGPAISAAALLAACGADDTAGNRTGCAEEALTCVVTEEQTIEPGADGAIFQISLRNRCDQPIDLKVCFEGTGARTADCREVSDLAASARTAVSIENRDFAEDIRIFARFSADANACSFPRSDRVRF